MSWLVALAWLCIALGVLSALWIVNDLRHRPQHMAVMAAVWPLCALFGGPAVLAFYLAHGRGPKAGGEDKGNGDHAHGHDAHGHDAHDRQEDTPFYISVAKGALHCGAGCALGDLLAESLATAVPGVLVVFGFPGLFPDAIFATWILDFLFAFVLGIIFQYYAIVPMQNLSPGQGIVAALKADALSLISWQVGMYGAMAIARFAIAGHDLGGATSPVFWFTMQIAMIAGFVTAYPTNWALIRAGVKEAM